MSLCAISYQITSEHLPPFPDSVFIGLILYKFNSLHIVTLKSTRKINRNALWKAFIVTKWTTRQPENPSVSEESWFLITSVCNSNLPAPHPNFPPWTWKRGFHAIVTLQFSNVNLNLSLSLAFKSLLLFAIELTTWTALMTEVCKQACYEWVLISSWWSCTRCSWQMLAGEGVTYA